MGKRKKDKKSDISETQIVNALMDYITDNIYFKDRESRFVRINTNYAKSYGIKNPEDAIGKTDFDFFSEEHARQAYKDEQRIIKTGQPMVAFEEKKTKKNKEEKWVSTTKMPFYNDKGKIIGTFGISRNITEKKKAEEKIKYLSFHDTLTGLYNRAYFDEEINRLDTERQLPITIVMGDINGLKVINDAYGHSKGDILLKKIAQVLKESFRREDIISRWGGDEFISILTKTTKNDAENIVERIKELCTKRSTTDMPLSISLGVSTKKTVSQDMNNVLKEAEDEMYKNKILNSESTHENLVSSLKENMKRGDYRSEVRIKKIQEYAVSVGEKLKLSKIRIEELKLLMDLHNIGKLALADEVMMKRGRLTAGEWKMIQRIPEIGYRIAKSSAKLKSIAESILAHHEWYNGQGYPRGIKGEEIPILSRISSLINAYEAMTGDRSYSRKMTHEEAIEEVKKCTGTQFDPRIVKIFLELLE